MGQTDEEYNKNGLNPDLVDMRVDAEYYDNITYTMDTRGV